MVGELEGHKRPSLFSNQLHVAGTAEGVLSEGFRTIRCEHSKTGGPGGMLPPCKF